MQIVGTCSSIAAESGICHGWTYTVTSGLTGDKALQLAVATAGLMMVFWLFGFLTATAIKVIRQVMNRRESA